MKETIKKIANNNRKIGMLETIRYCQVAYEQGIEDVYDLLVLLEMFRQDYGAELGSTDAIEQNSD